MKVALIYPKLQYHKESFSGIAGYAKIMRGYPPLSLAYVAAIIKKSGHEAIIIDANILNLNLNQVLKKIEDFSPDLLGFTVTTNTFHGIHCWIHAIKKMIDIPVIIGGALLELYPREVMQHKEIDYAIVGMGIDSLSKFLIALENKKDFSNIHGLCFRKNGKIIINEKDNSKEDISYMPLPARELLPNHKYYAPFSQKKYFTALITSRGCIFKCFYCCLSEQQQLRKVDDVINEIEECYYRFNIRDIDIYDAIFTVNRKRTMDICQKIREKKLKFSWRIRTHINLVDKELLEEMAASGCKMIMYGIESVNAEILKNLGRVPISVNQLRDKIALTEKAGISSFGFFMLGSPGETYFTMNNTVRISKKLGLDFVQFSRLALIPGTQLYNTYLCNANHDYWREFILNNAKYESILIGTRLRSDIIRRYVKKANLGFYLRPLHIIKIVCRIKNLGQLINYIKAGLAMLFSSLFEHDY